MQNNNGIMIVVKTAVSGENIPPRVSAIPKAFLQLAAGTEVRAEILGITDNGQTRVRINGELLSMDLPKNLTTGDTLQMTFLGKEPDLAFSVSLQQTRSVPVNISKTGYWLSQATQVPSGDTMEAGALPRLARLSEGPLFDTARLTSSLRQAVVNSGIFYESHLAEWAAGKRVIADIFLEPQASLSSSLVESSQQPSTVVPVAQAAIFGQQQVQPAPGALLLSEGITPAATALQVGAPKVTEVTTSYTLSRPAEGIVQTYSASQVFPPWDPTFTEMGLAAQATAQIDCHIAGDVQAQAGTALHKQKTSPEKLQQTMAQADPGRPSTLTTTGVSVPSSSAVSRGTVKPRQIVSAEIEMEAAHLVFSPHKGRDSAVTDEASGPWPSLSETVHADSRTASIVREQLATLNSGMFAWNGEAWQGQKMDWRVADREAQKQETTEGRFESELKLDLPQLGRIVASFRIRGKELRLFLSADAECSVKLLKQELPTLGKHLESAGLSLKGSVIRHDKAE